MYSPNTVQETASIHLPKVTIAIPTLNRANYLKLALESALGQTYGNLEVIVSNNASNDETSTWLASCTDPRLTILEQKIRLSMTANWNACFAAASGKYFLLLSDDDVLDADAISHMVMAYTHPEGEAPGIVYCGGRIIDAQGDTIRLFKESPLRETARSLIRSFFQNKRDLWFCGVLLRTADLRPGFNNNLRVACDAAAWMQAVMRHGTAVFIPGQHVSYRLHHNLSYFTQLDIWRDEYRQLHAILQAEDVRSGHPDAEFGSDLKTIMAEVDRALVAGRINQVFKSRKIRGLMEYGRYLPAFAGHDGLVFLLKRITSLLLGERGNRVRKRLLRGGRDA